VHVHAQRKSAAAFVPSKMMGQSSITFSERLSLRVRLNTQHMHTEMWARWWCDDRGD
jgi:hypothetical protein